MRTPRLRLRSLLLLIAAAGLFLGYGRHQMRRAELIELQEARVSFTCENYALTVTFAHRPLFVYELDGLTAAKALAKREDYEAEAARRRTDWRMEQEELERLKASW